MWNLQQLKDYWKFSLMITGISDLTTPEIISIIISLLIIVDFSDMSRMETISLVFIFMILSAISTAEFSLLMAMNRRLAHYLEWNVLKVTQVNKIKMYFRCVTLLSHKKSNISILYTYFGYRLYGSYSCFIYFCTPFQHITWIQSTRTNDYEVWGLSSKNSFSAFESRALIFLHFKMETKSLKVWANIVYTKSYKSIICSHRNYRDYYYLLKVYPS